MTDANKKDLVKIPAAIGPYSSHRVAGDLIITSGQLPIDAETGKLVEGDIHAQALMSLRNIEAILAEEGATLKDVMKFTVYMTDLAGFSQVNEAFEEMLSAPFPARTAIQIAKLPLNGEIEIEAIALRN